MQFLLKVIQPILRLSLHLVLKLLNFILISNTQLWKNTFNNLFDAFDNHDDDDDVVNKK